MTKLWPSLPQLTRLLSDHLGWSSTRTTLRYVKLSTSFSHYFQHNFLMTIILILFHPRYNLRQGWLGSSWTSPKKPVEALFSIVSIAMQWIVSIATAIHSLTHSVIVLSLADLRGLQVCLYSSDAVPINLNAIWPSERPIEGMCLSSTSVLKVAWMGLDGSLGLLLTLPPTSRIWTTFLWETRPAYENFTDFSLINLSFINVSFQLSIYSISLSLCSLLSKMCVCKKGQSCVLGPSKWMKIGTACMHPSPTMGF